MILYIISNEKEKYYFCTIEGKVNIKSVNVFINNYALKNLFNINEYNKCVAKVLNIKNQRPILFNDSLLLFKMRTYNYNEVVYINYKAILGINYINEEAMFVFNDASFITISLSYRSLMLALKKCNIIEKYHSEINKH